MGNILWSILLLAPVTAVFMFILSNFASRILAVRIGLGHLVLAGIMGLGAEVGLESQFV
jgi:ubiquinone biosynthesis protein